MIRELREQNEKLKSQLAGGKVDMAEIGKAIFLLHTFLYRWKSLEYFFFSVGCVIPHDRPRFPFNDMEISMIDICILDILIISILELFHAFFHAHKRGKAHFSALMSMEKLHVYHLGL